MFVWLNLMDNFSQILRRCGLKIMPKKGGYRKWPCKWLSVKRLKGALWESLT